MARLDPGYGSSVVFRMDIVVLVRSSVLSVSYNLLGCSTNAAGIAALQPIIGGVGRCRLVLYDPRGKGRDMRPFVGFAEDARLSVVKRQDEEVSRGASA